MLSLPVIVCFFFFNDTATTEIYTLSLHDALPISKNAEFISASRSSTSKSMAGYSETPLLKKLGIKSGFHIDRKSTRLNSSHDQISYAVFCLKKKNKHDRQCCHSTYKVLTRLFEQL